MVIRAGTPDDYPRLVAVWLSSVRATHHFLTERRIADLSPLIANHYLPMLTVWVAQDDSGQIGGFIGMSANKVEMLFVAAEQRGNGIGKTLLAFVEQQYDVLLLDVNEQNPQARAFYQHYGFRVIGRSERDGQGEPFPLLHMRREAP
ncbi:GNAT family N-acetyltransferase [Serratia sp. AKBS12]|uniref:GNAT family N-acetyltransferase n=1 Tax=Serratia sp. AKBS12 TaxID=2974597 RepID=UPI002165FED3|nr:GNAT family N-acetyltransferase [Serratia sp. AKBS12]MCS3409526.1 GNAT family N-acetyltransferase [Serratia sp. AKBS12]